MYTELEQAINNLLCRIGVAKLIKHLREIEINIDFGINKDYLFIKSIILDYFKITEKELFSNIKESKAVNARRILIFLLKEKTQIPKKSICEIAKINNKAYKRYLEHISDVTLNNYIDPELSKSLNEITEMYYKKTD
jgi:chromosomal replication initiation ATPase DnaA